MTAMVSSSHTRNSVAALLVGGVFFKMFSCMVEPKIHGGDYS